MPAPRWLGRFNKRVSNRLLEPLARRLPYAGVVIHAGRKTGHQYRTPVLVFPGGDRYVIALTYGPDTDWVKNVLAAGGSALETRGRVLELRDPRLFHDEQRQAMPAPVRVALGVLDVSDFLALRPERNASGETRASPGARGRRARAQVEPS